MEAKVGVPTTVAAGGWFTLKADGSAMWSATYPTSADLAASRTRPSRTTHAAPRPAPPAPTRQALPRPIPRVTPSAITISNETREVIRRVADPPKYEATRIFKHAAADTVPAATRAVASYAIRHALTLHGLPPDSVTLRWFTRLGPGATKMGGDEFHGPATMAGKTVSDGADGRTVTIFLKSDLSFRDTAETALHEGYHSIQYLMAPIGMRDAAILAQSEAMAQEFARSHLRDLDGLINSFQGRRRA